MLGDIVMFSNTFASHVDMRNRWNADPPISGGGVIIDNGTHSVDIARYLFGPIAETLAVPGRPVQELGVEDSARLLLRMHNGALGTVQLSWSWETAANTYLEVVGTDAVLRVGWTRSRFKQRSSPHWVEYGSGYDKVAAHSKQLDVFAAAVRGEGELLVTPADALASVAAIEAAYTSLAEDRWVPVDPRP
jgi:predicted dehydrogenase